MRGYLIGYMFWLGLSLGCMALLMVQYLSGGLGACRSGGCWKRQQVPAADVHPVHARSRFCGGILYAWMSDPSLTAHNAWYLNIRPGGCSRWIVYFAIWIGLMSPC